ncbi:MAG: hypothetical protein GX340_09630 [Clostridiales bacterium]|nr:hypothetical protein [Clostridiales bacterium]
MKADGSDKIAVQYFKAIPQINAPAEDTSFSLKQPALMVTGVFLIVLINRKQKDSK